MMCTGRGRPSAASAAAAAEEDSDDDSDDSDDDEDSSDDDDSDDEEDEDEEYTEAIPVRCELAQAWEIFTGHPRAVRLANTVASSSSSSSSEKYSISVATILGKLDRYIHYSYPPPSRPMDIIFFSLKIYMYVKFVYHLSL